MTNKELIEFNKNRKICQICLVTSRENIEELLDEWINKLKVGPWIVCEMSNENVDYCGWGDDQVTEPWKYTCAVAMYGNIQIEIIKKHYGVFPGDKFLRDRDEGLQHFKEQFSEEAFDSAVKQFEEAGLKKSWWGGMEGDRFCNFSCEDELGFSLEIGNFVPPQIENIPEDAPYYVYPRE